MKQFSIEQVEALVVQDRFGDLDGIHVGQSFLSEEQASSLACHFKDQNWKLQVSVPIEFTYSTLIRPHVVASHSGIIMPRSKRDDRVLI